MEVMNGGIFAGILRIVKDDGGTLSEKDEAYLKKMEALPKNVWVPLDNDGNPITREEASDNFKKELERFTVINPHKQKQP